MEIGIVGLSKSGKTTVFNAVTRGHAEMSAYGGGEKVNLGVAKVPDPRVQPLVAMHQPKKIVQAEVKYLDIPGAPKGLGKGEGLSGPFLHQLRQVDLLIHVVRAFEDASVPHIEGSVDPHRDIDTMDLEMAFADLAVIERRIEKVKELAKSPKQADRDSAARESVLLGKLKDVLGAGTPVRKLELSEAEQKAVSPFGFLTAKPLLLVINIGEDRLGDALSMETEYQAKHGDAHARVTALCGKLEQELSQLEDTDAAQFRESVGLRESGLDRMVRLSYEMLGLITFFTCGPDEVRAWTITRGMNAQQAAGRIHSDLERGFIRAEVTSYKDMVDATSFAEARKRGTLRMEGKTYTVRDGDVIEVLFNV